MYSNLHSTQPNSFANSESYGFSFFFTNINSHLHSWQPYVSTLSIPNVHSPKSHSRPDDLSHDSSDIDSDNCSHLHTW